MRAPDAAELLDLWERGLTQPLPRRALALLRAAWPEAPDAELLALPLGARDARLLALRRLLFGRDLTVVASCPACGDTVESTFEVDDVMVPLEQQRDARTTRVIERDGLAVTFRLPACADLLALAEASGDPRRQLLDRCVLAVHRTGETSAAAASSHDASLRDTAPPDTALIGGAHAGVALSDEMVAAIAEDMAAADPQADVQLACTCPACGEAWPMVFDIASVLWSEIHAWARRLLRDVHALARAYGWREADVLALGPTRRQIYLELARS